MTPDHDVDSDFEHLYPPRKWGDPMGKPFDEERAPRMDATSRAAAEIDRVHTLEARIAILETELRACTRLRTENERLRVVALIGDAQHAVCEYDLEQSVNSLRDVEAERDLLRNFKAGVPWDDLYTCIILANGNGDADAVPEDRAARLRAARWHDLNEPKEAQP